MPDEAVIDAPAELTIGDTSGADVSSDAGSPEADQIDNADSPQPGETGHLRGAELYKSVKDLLKEGKPLTSAQMRSIRNAIHIADKADKLANGDLDSISKNSQLVSRLADDPESGETPDQLIENTLAERTFWRSFDDKFQNGDAALIAEMSTANPESFQKLILPAVNKFAEMNPDGYSALVAQATVSYMNQNEIPLQFSILRTFLPSMPDFPGKDNVVEAINKIFGVTESLKSMASKPIVPKAGEGQPNQPGKLDQTEQSTEALTIRANRAEWQSEVERPGIDLRNSEMNRVAQAQKVQLTEEDKQKIRLAVNEEMNTRLQADSRYGQAMRGYLTAGNKKAYADRALSEYKKLVPSITRRHTQAVIDDKKNAPKPVVNAQQKNGAVKPVNQNQPGIQWLSGPPKTVGKQVDYNRTTNRMLSERKAYLVGEKALYQWRAPK